MGLEWEVGMEELGSAGSTGGDFVGWPESVGVGAETPEGCGVRWRGVGRDGGEGWREGIEGIREGWRSGEGWRERMEKIRRGWREGMEGTREG